MTRRYKFGESIGAFFKVLRKALGLGGGHPEEEKIYITKNYVFSVNGLDLIIDVDLPEVEVPKMTVSTAKVNLPKKVFD